MPAPDSNGNTPESAYFAWIVTSDGCVFSCGACENARRRERTVCVDRPGRETDSRQSGGVPGHCVINLVERFGGECRHHSCPARGSEG